MKDKRGVEIKVGDTISNKFTNYKVVEYEGELHADNGGHMFPLDSENERVWERYKVLEG